MYCSNGSSSMATLLQQKNCMKTLSNGGASNSTVVNTGSSNGGGQTGVVNSTVATVTGGAGVGIGGLGTRTLLPHEMVGLPVVPISSATVGQSTTALFAAAAAAGHHSTSNLINLHHHNNSSQQQSTTNFYTLTNNHNHQPHHHHNNYNNSNDNNINHQMFNNHHNHQLNNHNLPHNRLPTTITNNHLQQHHPHHHQTTSSSITCINSLNTTSISSAATVAAVPASAVTSSSPVVSYPHHHHQQQQHTNSSSHLNNSAIFETASTTTASSNHNHNHRQLLHHQQIPQHRSTNLIDVSRTPSDGGGNVGGRHLNKNASDGEINLANRNNQNYQDGGGGGAGGGSDVEDGNGAGGGGVGGEGDEIVADEVPDEEMELEPPPEIDIVINNVVCSFSVRCHLNLREIALNGFNVEFRREHGMVTMKLRRPYTTASIWSSGRITCTGATSEEQAKIAARRYARCLQRLGFSVRFQNFRVVNVLGTCSMPWAIKIINFSERFKKDAYYEPELHPGVTYKLKSPKATLKIFSTGSITVTAASVAHVQAAIEHIFPLVYEFRKERTAEQNNAIREKRRAQMFGKVANDPTEDIMYVSDQEELPDGNEDEASDDEDM